MQESQRAKKKTLDKREIKETGALVKYGVWSQVSHLTSFVHVLIGNENYKGNNVKKKK